MITAPHTPNSDSSINHAVMAACLSAFVTIAILVAPSLGSILAYFS